MLLMATCSLIIEAAMQRTPLQTLLAERLQSARGLGWPMPDTPALPKGGGGDFSAIGRSDTWRSGTLTNPAQPPFGKGGSISAWFRLAHAMLNRLGFTR